MNVGVLRDAFSKLETIYQTVPPVACKACGACCVSPHMTIVEFAYMLETLLDRFTPQQMITLLQTPPQPSARHSGNTECMFQNAEKRCILHKARSLSCRIEGLPVLELMGLRETPVCPYMQSVERPGVHPIVVDTWVKDVFQLSAPYHAVYCEPWFLNAVTPECWWAIVLDEKIDQPFFADLRAQIRNEFNLDFLVPYYNDQTGLAKKICLIEQFFAESEKMHPQRALKAIRRVVHDFPLTGSYYQHEGAEYFRLIKKIARRAA